MHFFIDHTQLTSQGSSDGFGPSSGDPTNKYDVSANFQLDEDAMAFACQSGHIIVTDFFDVETSALDPDLVNIILKSMDGPAISVPTVKYYIYRGIKRDSFFTDDGRFNKKDEISNTDTVSKMWKDWEANVTPTKTPLPLAPSDLGFDASLAGTVHIEEIFGNFRAPLRAREVREGEWIGTFTSDVDKKICFEVIVEAELLNLDLEYARKSKVQIDVSALTAILNPTPEQVHTLRCEREKILAYMDPAALFGMHYSVGVSGFGLSKAQKRDDLVTTFLSKFSTATRVYLDIRSEKGYSYNFYRNYGGGGSDLLKLKTTVATTTSGLPYEVHNWPLFSSSDAAGPKINSKWELQLRIDDNTLPLLYVEDPDYLAGRRKNHFLDQKKLKTTAATDWTDKFVLKFPATGLSGSRVNVANHIRLQYFKQETTTPIVNPHLLRFASYLDRMFGGIDLKGIDTAAAFQQIWNDKVGLVEEGGTVGLLEETDFAFVPYTGMYFDSSNVLLFSEAKHAYRETNDVYPKFDPADIEPTTIVRSKVFPKDVIFNQFEIVEAPNTLVKIIEMAGFNKSIKSTKVDNVALLGLTRSEFDTLTALSGFGPVHQRYLVFGEIPNTVDLSGISYKKYRLQVQGLDVEGNRTVKSPSSDIFVYGTGSNMYCSKAFAATVTLPVSPPDPALKREWRHVASMSYDKNDPDVKAVSPLRPGFAKITDDVGNDLTTPTPTVELRAKYFFPIAKKGETVPDPIKAEYPLVVIVHGNGQDYGEYHSLAKHLARNGFIVASIDLRAYVGGITLIPTGPVTVEPYHFDFRFSIGPDDYFYDSEKKRVGRWDFGTSTINILHWEAGKGFDTVPTPGSGLKVKAINVHDEGMASRGRANVLFEHLKILKRKFGLRVDNKIGLIGHSRGGEAVVHAATHILDSSSPAPLSLNNVQAVASLAPTDTWEREELTEEIPYFVLYGSRDGDISGKTLPLREQSIEDVQPTTAWGSGAFSLYDRAINNTIKAMAFVYGGTHNGFITNNHDYPYTRDPILPVRQKRIAKGYFNAFFRHTLHSEPVWKSYLTGEHRPRSVGYRKIYMQYADMGAPTYIVDNFEDTAHNWALSSSGQAVSHNKESSLVPSEGILGPFETVPATIDRFSPHDTNGLAVEWSAGMVMTFTIDPARKDVSSLSHVSLRITHAADPLNSTGKAYPKLDDLQVRLVDTSTPPNQHGVKIPKQVPNPDHRPSIVVRTTLGDVEVEFRERTKSALMTIRIPLSEYQSNGVDWKSLSKLELVFPNNKESGKVIIDDIAFTN
jgi:dienelactone hydrolase